jgi:DNA polymerase III subunit epsilon
MAAKKSNKLYAVIDIETTGGLPKRDKITEIAIILYDGTKEVESFTTLINPERSIPPEITRITGITYDMVKSAPKFYEIAKTVVELTEGAIFVAHNVSFDYNFIREEFANLGFTYTRKQLCTVKLSRKAFPGLKSYSLGSLIQHFGIQVNARHRAYDDTRATTIILDKILHSSDQSENVNHIINRGIRETRLPEGFTIEHLHNFPESPGVYYMYNRYNRVLYVGKSINIKKRMMQHFGDNTRKTDRMLQEVKDIDYVETGHELLAIILESYEIKNLHPEINKAQKTKEYPYFIYTYSDQDEYINFAIDKISKKTENRPNILNFYSSLQSAKSVLGFLRAEYLLCESRLNKSSPLGQACLLRQMGECMGACLHIEAPEMYNERAELAKIHISRLFTYDFFIVVSGRTFDESGLILIENGIFKGYGYLPNNDIAFGVEEMKEAIEILKPNHEVNSLIFNYLEIKKDYKIIKI